MTAQIFSRLAAGVLRNGRLALAVCALALLGLVWSAALADVPMGYSQGLYVPRPQPRGTVPNPGTQQQELANITFPAPYNVFEFVVTCAACHGGTVDQNAAHFGNWAGTSMASAARDPVFRAVQISTNARVKALTTLDGAGNVCIRCHSPNAWLSGRADPHLNGFADGSTIENSILLSTDTEGIMCESCHRVMGGVEYKRPDLVAANPADPVWNLMAGISDWPHQGNPYPQGPVPGLPYGDSTLQFNDGMTYAGKYNGSVFVHYSDTPMAGTGYTGQTYGVIPMPYADAGKPAVNPDGSISLHFEEPVGPMYGELHKQALSLEHPTTVGNFITKPEFCGGCHDLTIPIANSGMPEQRTYTEWRHSDFGRATGSPTYKRCQDCHMPTRKHEYSDSAKVSLNPDPVVSGWFPYAKDRNPWGGTAFHKFAGANVDLPRMMKKLYPQPDLEVIGAPTGNDTRIFPGMLSTRDPMYDRSERNTVSNVHAAIAMEIARAPVQVGVDENGVGVYEMDVRVENKSGHRVPSGYPDGRRMWLEVKVTNAASAVIYESGHYDAASATLRTDSQNATLTRAIVRNSSGDGMLVDAAAGRNAVMIYEKLTGAPSGDGSYTQSPDILNSEVVFDNRIPPAGYSYDDYKAAGAKFITFDPATWAPSEDVGRYPNGRNFDLVTYRFIALPDQVLDAKATVLWQTHTREFMEFIKQTDSTTLRPTGPINAYMPGYPLSKNYLFDNVPAEFKADLAGQPLADNWGGLAYAAWLMTGKGAPQLVAVDRSGYGGPLGVPALTGRVADPFTIVLDWSPVADAEAYVLEVRLGTADATADWDTLSVVFANQPLTVTHSALNVAKTYAYRIRAVNGDGQSAVSAELVMQTPIDLPLAPEALRVLSVTDASVTLAWNDVSDNEDGFIIERQDLSLTGQTVGPFAEIARMAAPNPAGFGGVTWTDPNVLAGRTYNYRVAAYNASGWSTFAPPVQATLQGVAAGGVVLTGVAGMNGVSLTWSAPGVAVPGYAVWRSETGADAGYVPLAALGAETLAYLDAAVPPDAPLWFKVTLTDGSLPSNVLAIRSLALPPAAPASLNTVMATSGQINLSWTDNADNELGFTVTRTEVGNPAAVVTFNAPANATAVLDVAFASETKYEYVVRAYNNAGESAASNAVILTTPQAGQIINPPIAQFAGAPLLRTRVVGPAPLTAAFDNLSQDMGQVTDYLWDFGDGQTLMSPNKDPVTHLYGLPGVYSVTLTATGPGGVNVRTATGYVLVHDGPAIQMNLQPGPSPDMAWRIDGGPWLSGGALQDKLSLGDHLVEFRDAPGYRTPDPVTVTAASNQLQQLEARYVRRVATTILRTILP